MTRILPPPRERGFTLIEILVVLAMLSVVALVAVPSLRSSRTNGSKAQLVIKAREQLRRARMEALASGTPQSLNAEAFSPGSRLEGGIFSSQALTFYPDGSSSGGTIILAPGAALQVEWLTGTAHEVP